MNLTTSYYNKHLINLLNMSLNLKPFTIFDTTNRVNDYAVHQIYVNNKLVTDFKIHKTHTELLIQTDITEPLTISELAVLHPQFHNQTYTFSIDASQEVKLTMYPTVDSATNSIHFLS